MIICFCCIQDYYSLLFLSETIKSVGTRRQIMVICPFLKTSVSFNQDYYIKVFFASQRQSSSLAHREKLWSSAPFRRLQCFSIKTIKVIFAFQRQSSWLACEDNHGHLLLLFSRLLQSSLPSRDNQVCWHAETILVILFCCFQDYYSLLCLPKTIKNVGLYSICLIH